MKNNKKKTRMTKVEKRRLAFAKRNVKRKQSLRHYGAEDGIALVVAKATDVNRRFLASFLALVFAISCLVIGVNFAGRADDSQANMKPAGTAGVVDQESGMVVNKYLEPNGEGNYDLKLEAYSTKEMKPITEKVPTDFIIVADQSGSMSTSDMPTGYSSVGPQYIETIANGDYYFKSGDNYYRVYPERGFLYQYYAPNSLFSKDVIPRSAFTWFTNDSDTEISTTNSYYYKANGKYCQLHYNVVGRLLRYHVTPYYTNESGTTTLNAPAKPNYKNIAGGDIVPGTGWIGDDSLLYTAVNTFCKGLSQTAFTYAEVLGQGVTTGMYFDFPMYRRRVGYTKLCYRDIDGVEHTLPTTNGLTTLENCDNSGQALRSETGSRAQYSNLYTSSGTKITRLEALKTALRQFAEKVAKEEDSFGPVDNKVSLIGFSSQGYNNTELLTGENLTVSNNNGTQKNTADNNISEHYGKALVAATDGTTGRVNDKITAGIDALTASGGTQPEDGLEMAQKVLDNRSNTTYTIKSGAQKGSTTQRNTIVIFFTDGHPGDYDYSDMYSEANDVIEAAAPIKTAGTKIFSIGVFGEADGNPLTYPAHEVSSNNKNDDWEYDLGWMETYHDEYYPYHYFYLNRNWLSDDSSKYGETPNDTIYDYMSVVSSNYPNAQKFMNVKDNDPAGEAKTTDYDSYLDMCNTVRGASTAEENNKYYRMASNQDTLIAAFMQAVTMNNDEAVSPPVDLTGNAVLMDVLSEHFEVVLPEGQSKPVITCKTVKCTMDANKKVTEDSGEDAWDDITDQLGDSNIGYDEETKTISIKGFSYTDYYIANPKPEDTEHGLEVNQGKKLVVTIKNVLPTPEATSKDEVIYSNDGSSSGLYVPSKDDAQTLKKQKDLPLPSISRHSYTLDVTGDDESTATFKVAPSLVNGSNNMSNVILAYPNGEGGLTRIKYADYLNASDKYFDMKDGQSFYFENVPADYSVETSIKAKDTANTYTWTDLNPEVDLSIDNPTSNSANPNPYSDSKLHITSVANVRTVTIKEAVDNSAFANQGDKFVPTVYIEAPTGVNVDETATFGETEWRQYGENRMALNKELDPIKADGQESITLTLPSGWKLIVNQTDDNDYSVKSATYKVDSTEATSDYAEGGWNWTITKDATITITNTRPSIPVEGINNSSNHNWIIYLLVGIAAIAVIAGGIFLWKKKDEFVEQ